MSEAFDYDISIRIARELGTPTLHVVNGHERGVAEIEENIRMAEILYEQYQYSKLGRRHELGVWIP